MGFLISQCKKLSIRAKIFLFYAVILMASLSVLAFLSIKISNQAIVDKATKNAERELTLINKSLLNLTQNVEDYVRILSTDNRMQFQLERFQNMEMDSLEDLEVTKILSTAISGVTQPITRIDSASIMSSKQVLFDIGFVDNDSIYPVLNSRTVDMITKNKTPTWLGLIKIKYKYRREYENVFAVSKTIIGLDTGHILGTAVLYIKEKDVANIYLDNIVNKEDKFYIIDDQNTIISTQDKGEIYNKFDEEKYLGGYTISEMSQNKSIISNVDGIQALVTVQNFDKLNWKLISIIPLDEITYENKVITKLILGIGAICLIIAFIISFFISFTITRPVFKLAAIMKEIKAGNMELRAKFKSQDEIAMLAEGFNSLMDRINNLLNQVYQQQKFKRESEFKLLQAQIKPHFLYNTIETIISFIKLGLHDNAISTAKYLAGFYRVSLSKGNDIISINDEMRLIDNYLSIQKLRYVEYIDYKLDFNEEILKYQIPKLTLQPLVENSIYHGLKEKEEKGLITIKGYFEENIIKIEITDDGVGMSEELIHRVLSRPSKEQNKTDFGVYSVDARIKLLYGEDYGIKIESSVGKYTKVTVRMPAISVQEG